MSPEWRTPHGGNTAPSSLWEIEAHWSQVGGREMRLHRQRGQLSGAPAHGGRPPARLSASRGHPGDPVSPNHHRSPLFPWSRRVLPAICENFCSHRRPPACPDQERRGLSLELWLPGRLRPPQNAPHYQSHHRLPWLQPALRAIHRCVNRRPWCNPGTSPWRQGVHHLLWFEVAQPGWKSLPWHKTGMPRHCMGRC